LIDDDGCCRRDLHRRCSGPNNQTGQVDDVMSSVDINVGEIKNQKVIAARISISSLITFA
jgi:hypothetical protein